MVLKFQPDCQYTLVPRSPNYRLFLAPEGPPTKIFRDRLRGCLRATGLGIPLNMKDKTRRHSPRRSTGRQVRQEENTPGASPAILHLAHTMHVAGDSFWRTLAHGGLRDLTHLVLTGPEAVLTARRGERIKRSGAAPSHGPASGAGKAGGLCKPAPLLPLVRTPDEAQAELQPAATPDRWQATKASCRTRFGCGGLHDLAWMA